MNEKVVEVSDIKVAEEERGKENAKAPQSQDLSGVKKWSERSLPRKKKRHQEKKGPRLVYSFLFLFADLPFLWAHHGLRFFWS